MLKKLTLITLLLTILIFTISSVDLDFSGMLRTYSAITLEDATLIKNEQTFDFTVEGWKGISHFSINPYAYIGVTNEPEIGIREAFVDIYFDNADLRIGKQVITWGQAEGAFITDIVSPKDMRSFILADFREIRKGVIALKGDYYLGPFTFEGIWLPIFVNSSMPSSDSIWMRPLPIPGLKTVEPDPVEPIFTNSEFFGKIRYFGPSISWELMGGYTWTDEPFIKGIIIPQNEALLDYKRFGVAGGSISTVVGNTVLRGEAAAYFNKPFTRLLGGPPPTVEVKELHQIQTLVGIDFSFLGIETSTQYLLSYVNNHVDGLIEQGKKVKEFDHTATFRMQKTFLESRLTVKLFSYVEIEPLNALIRPSLSYSIEDGLLVEGGLELFVGDANGTFGVYKDNSMGFLALRWYF